jgi:hypothetical protein
MAKFTTGNTAGKGRKPGSVNVATAEGRSLATRLLSSAKYRRNFRQRLESGTLAPPLEALMWAYAYGRPPADPPEPLTPIPAEPLRALAVKLFRLEGEDFRMALAGICAHEVSTAPPKALPEGGPPMLGRLESWTAHARALCEQTAQYPEPPALARHLAAELAAELPVHALLDAAQARGGLVNVVAMLISHPPAANGGFLEWGELLVLDEATATAVAPLLEAALLRTALSKLTAVSV